MPSTARQVALTVGAVILAIPADDLVLLAATVAVLLHLGVVLPAVYFRDEKRRRDARLVLQQLLDFLRRPAQRNERRTKRDQP